MEEILRGFLRHLATLEKADGDESGFSKEFSSIKKYLASISDQLDLSTEAGSARGNIKKNRYKDILPYDQTRVPLTLLENEGYSDYINANFIRGIDGDKYYIATQGPLGQTVVDLWRMIWEYQVKVVVMACREFELGKKKCERYWATEEEGTVVFGPFTVTRVGEETLRDEVTIRTLSVTMLDDVDQRSVVQFQYTAWPDHGIPEDFDSLLEMIDLMHQWQGSLKSPICVHCSAGCGRTGVICAVDYVRSMLLRKVISEDFAIMDIVKEMRRQRPAAVQTKDQYEFTYRIVAEMFQRELEAADHDYENLEKDGRPCGGLDVKHLPPPKAAASSEPRSPSSPALRALAPGSMASQGAAGATYAAVGRRREGGGPRPASSYVLPSSSGCAYENLGQAPGRPLSSSTSSSYSAVGFGDSPRVLPQKTQFANLHPLSTPAAPPHVSTISYSTIAFGQQGSEPISHTDEDTEEWVPSLPERTADSYIVQDPGEVPASSPVTDSKNWTGKLLGPFKQAIPGGIEKKVEADEAYEDVTGLHAASNFSSSGLGFNARVAKPKGPRPPPEVWALYSH